METIKRSDNPFKVKPPIYPTKDMFTRELIKNVRFVSFAESGAMGRPGEVVFLLDDGNFYSVAYYLGNFTLDEIFEVFPVLRDCHFGIFGHGSTVPKGWKYVSLGAGNHLIVREDLYLAFKDALGEGLSEVDIYQRWRYIASKL